jgi:UDP-2-acetamido-2,6-beta-L-arabino-hexul-4-ose reductase
MGVVVTGARGFIGKNLVVALRRAGVDVAEIGADAPEAALAAAVRGAGVVFHLAGVNRPEHPEHDEEFVAGNVGSVASLLAAVDRCSETDRGFLRPLIVLASSTQAARDNPYGRSKLAAERALEAHAARTGAPVVIYRLPGVFGKWCRPNYNSVVATFCHNIARDLPIAISDPSHVLQLVHVDDVVARFLTHLDGQAAAGVARGEAGPVFTVSLGDLADRLRGFRAMRDTLLVADPIP